MCVNGLKFRDNNNENPDGKDEKGKFCRKCLAAAIGRAALAVVNTITISAITRFQANWFDSALLDISVCANKGIHRSKKIGIFNKKLATFLNIFDSSL